MTVAAFKAPLRARGRLVELPIGDICRHPYEPDRRDEKVQTLQDEIAYTGVIVPLVVDGTVPKPYPIIDGNRRFKAVRALGYQTVPVLLLTDQPTGVDSNVQFVCLNGRTMNMQAAHYLTFITKAPQREWDRLLKKAPGGFRARFRRLQQQVGVPYVLQIAKIGSIGPLVSEHADRFLAHIKTYLPDTESAPEIGDVVRWIIEHRMSNEVNMVLRAARQGVKLDGRKLRAMAKAIRKDVPYGR